MKDVSILINASARNVMVKLMGSSKHRTPRLKFNTPKDSTIKIGDKEYHFTDTSHMSMRDKLHWQKRQKHKR